MTGGYGEVQSSQPGLLADVRAALSSRPSRDASLPIGLIGCGWIAGMQLEAYRAEGFEVVALADRTLERADEYRRRYFPDAVAYDSVDALVRHPGLAVVDVATHLEGRPEIVRAALSAGLHVISQKPFVEDLSEGERLAEAAEAADKTLAVNQNGRWAPHFGAMLGIVRAGIIGEVVSADFSVAWAHDLMIAGKPAFEQMPDLVLFDFGAHWFDIVGVLAPEVALTVYAFCAPRPGQVIDAPLQADALVYGDSFVASLCFRAGERFAETGSFRVAGTSGVITHNGMALGGAQVTVETADGVATIAVADDWFRWGLAGTMGEMLTAHARDREPTNSASSALRGLGISFAALESARIGNPVQVGQARTRSGAAVLSAQAQRPPMR